MNLVLCLFPLISKGLGIWNLKLLSIIMLYKLFLYFVPADLFQVLSPWKTACWWHSSWGTPSTWCSGWCYLHSKRGYLDSYSNSKTSRSVDLIEFMVRKYLLASLTTFLENNIIIIDTGIYWDKLSQEKLGQIRILRELKNRVERETGQLLPCGPSEKLPPTAQRRQRR